jgi:hypothetical protein
VPHAVHQDEAAVRHCLGQRAARGGGHTEQQAMDLLDAQLDLTFGPAR